MRYYDLSITSVTGTQSSFHLTSLGPGGNFNPGALNIEFDASVWGKGIPQSLTTVRIWGVPLTASGGLPGIDQATDLNKATVLLKAGMSKGLPLAKPAYAGPILSGKIFQAFGNWIQTDMTIDLVVSPDGTGTIPDPSSSTTTFVFSWAKGQKISEAIQNTLETAYGSSYTVVVNVSDNLVATQNNWGCYLDIETFTALIRAVSLNLIKTPGYPGIDILILPDNLIEVFDGTTAPKNPAKTLLFEDLIGQPTWIGPGIVQFNCPVRADISCNDVIRFPKLRATQSAAEMSNQPQDKSAFSGDFAVNLVRHVGNFRQPAAQSWITTFNARVDNQATLAKAVAGDPAQAGFFPNTKT